MSEPGKYVRAPPPVAGGEVKKRNKNKNKNQKNKVKINGKSVKVNGNIGVDKPNLKKQLKKERKRLKKLSQSNNLVQNDEEKKVKPKPKSRSEEENGNFQDKLANSLKASRFRYLNELLYTHKSDQATNIINQDPTAFTTYHEGYRHQVEQWPINPLDRIIKSIKAL